MQCECEKRQNSIHSPGPVIDGEKVARFLYLDDHVDELNGTLKPGAFPITELIERNGYSFSRLSYVDDTYIDRRAREFVRQDTGRRFLGIAVCHVEKVRCLALSSSKRALCVVDDGLEGDPSHALVCLPEFLRDEEIKRDLKHLLKPVRKALLELCSMQSTKPI